jgi:hypothetical protein
VPVGQQTAETVADDRWRQGAAVEQHGVGTAAGVVAENGRMVS